MKPSSYCSDDRKRNIIQRSGWTAFYQSYSPLSVLASLSIEVLVSATPPTFLKGF